MVITNIKGRLLRLKTRAAIDMVNPIVAANLLGLKTICLRLKPAIGTIIFLDMRARILNFGIRMTLIEKSIIKIITGIIFVVMTAVKDNRNTCIATPLTAASLTLNGLFNVFMI